MQPLLSFYQGNTEALYANVGKAHEQGNDKMSVLKKPFRIELRKTAVIVSYRAIKLGVSGYIIPLHVHGYACILIIYIHVVCQCTSEGDCNFQKKLQ